jgi:hypothetical protein
MKIVRLALVGLLTASMSGAPAFAGELQDSIAKAATAAAADPQETPMVRTGGMKAATAAGSALFAGGMAFGLYQFINNSNGSNSEFGEAEATNPKLGFVGLGTAFAGGMLMLMGHRAQKMPSLTFGRQSVGLAKRFSW